MERYKNLGEALAAARARPFIGGGEVYIDHSLIGACRKLVSTRPARRGMTGADDSYLRELRGATLGGPARRGMTDSYMLDLAELFSLKGDIKASLDRVVRRNPYARWVVPMAPTPWQELREHGHLPSITRTESLSDAIQSYSKTLE